MCGFISPQRAAVTIVFISVQFFLASFAYGECVSTKGEIERNIFGLADLSLHEQQTMALMEDIGVEWVRMEVRWDYVEPARGHYQWNETDRIVKNLRHLGINIQIVVDHPPVWAHPIETFNHDFAGFMRLLVQRYKPLGVRHWEIFNEPNLPGYGWPFRYDDIIFAARFYASVLETANVAIREHDSHAVIMNAGLSPDGIDPFHFLEILYGAIGRECFDVLAFHPYGQMHHLPDLTQKIRTIMMRHEDGAKPIWFNEYGTGDDEERAALLKLLAEQIGTLDGFIWFSLRDLKRSGWHFGLVDYNWQKKPDYEQFKKIYQTWKERRRVSDDHGTH